MRLTKTQFGELWAWATILANAEKLTMKETDQTMTYSIGDINLIGAEMLDLLEIVEGEGE